MGFSRGCYDFVALVWLRKSCTKEYTTIPIVKGPSGNAGFVSSAVVRLGLWAPLKGLGFRGLGFRGLGFRV